MRSFSLVVAVMLFTGFGPAAPVECRREFVSGAGVTFIECADRTSAIVTHGDTAHCVPGAGGRQERRQLSCDDGLVLSLEAGPQGGCRLLSGDATKAPPASAVCVARPTEPAR